MQAYQEGLPPHYTAEYHNAKLLAAMSVYSMQASYKTTTCAFKPILFRETFFAAITWKDFSIKTNKTKHTFFFTFMFI
jgi:hypothetical protein